MRAPPMNAVAVLQPWASRLADGGRTINVKAWTAEYSGPLQIVSATIPSRAPARMGLAVVELVDYRRMVATYSERAGRSLSEVLCKTRVKGCQWVPLRIADTMAVRDELPKKQLAEYGIRKTRWVPEAF